MGKKTTKKALPKEKIKPTCICNPEKKPRKIVQRAKLADIIEALHYENEISNKRKTSGRECIKEIKYIPRHDKVACVPMVPSMHTRLKYLGHCSLQAPCRPPEKPRKSPLERKLMLDSTIQYDLFGEKKAPKIKYEEYISNNTIVMKRSVAVIRHASDTSIIKVPSPKESGEVIRAQKAVVRPEQLKPPLPAKSGHDLYKPHSGIFINKTKDFVPDIMNVPAKIPRAPKKAKRCPKGTCNKIICRRKKCRRFAFLKKQRRTAKLLGTGMKTRTIKAKETVYRGLGKNIKCGKSKHPRKLPQMDDDEVCGLDDFPKPEHAHIPRGLKKGMFRTHSLTVLPCKKDKRPDVHYGILKASCNMYDTKFGGRSRGRQGLTMSVMAYCLAFHYHPKQWTVKLLDNLMDAGDQWYLQCADKVHDHSAYQGVCEVLPFGKKQTLLLNAKRMQVLLCEPDIVGYTMSMDPTVYNLCRALKAFFLENRAGIFLTRVLKVVVWKDKICYYIFDPAGRNSKAYSNFAQGFAALINVKDLDSVAEILLARSIVEDQKFILAPLKVLKMVKENADEDIDSDKELTQAEKALMSYRIMNETCAIVNANMHLGDRCFEDTKYRQALPIAIAAMTYAKISPPNTWFTKTLDKILRIGNKLYVDFINPKVMIDLTIDNIPNEITIGPYACEVIIYRERVKGQLFTTKECIFNIDSGLTDFFEHEHNCAILEFNNYVLAIWKQKDMFYLFDPYPRTTDGLRSFKVGKACCLMLLNVDAVVEMFIKNWDYLPMTTQFWLHGFKVLKLKKKTEKAKIICTLSDDQLPGAKKTGVKRKVLASQGDGDGKEFITGVMQVEVLANRSREVGLTSTLQDEEKMGDIISLVDSIQEDYVPQVPLRFKNMPPEELEPKVVNLDSPTVSVTQVVPPWPKPRDKTNEPEDADPEPVPTPPPTPPPPPPPEGAEEEEEEEEEEEGDEDDEGGDKKRDLKKEAEEEARRKAEELPPPLPPPPPSPQPEPEPPLVPPLRKRIEEEVETLEPVQADRRVLLTEDARTRYKMRQLRKKLTTPLAETNVEITASEELLKPSNFNDLFDGTQIIRGGTAGFNETEAMDQLPFAAIMAVVMSYKYTIDTWTPSIVDFVVGTARKLFQNKKEKFQLAPVHVIPKISIGHQSYKVSIDVATEGPTWNLESILECKFFSKYDRGMITTTDYSCAVFKRNGLYYLYDGNSCNGMGLRDKVPTGKPCFLRFYSLGDMVSRIWYNKDGEMDDQQFFISRIVVRRLFPERRLQLPEDYDYTIGRPTSVKSKLVLTAETEPKGEGVGLAKPKGKVGYQQFAGGLYRVEGTTKLTIKTPSQLIKPCHFVCLIAMLMAAMHPIRTWDHFMVDTCIEKGLEISSKAKNLSPCDKRVIKNIILDGKFININIKKITVINENEIRRLEQYVKAVMKRVRYVIIRFPECSLVICLVDGYFHVFDPYAAPIETPNESKPVKKEVRIDENETAEEKKERKKREKEKKELKKKKKKEKQKRDKERKAMQKKGFSDSSQEESSLSDSDTNEPTKVKVEKKPTGVAAWTLYPSLDALIKRIRKVISMGVESPEFYTFELTSIKDAPAHAAFNYRLSPLFRPDENPNAPYLKPKKIRPLVDEKMYWLDIEIVPWSRANPVNDLGLPRKTPQTMWLNWDIEFPGDLYSLWGTIHPSHPKFPVSRRGKQHLATSVIAIAMVQACEFSAWTTNFLDGIVIVGDKYHKQSMVKVGDKKDYELRLEDLDSSCSEMWPYSFTLTHKKVIFGFMYNIYPDRFNLSKALDYFFGRNNKMGILTSPAKNLAFGKNNTSYFMYDCQSFGSPLYTPNSGATYIMKCESINRLIYCMTVAMNVTRHELQFHLYSVTVPIAEHGEKKKK